MSLCLGPATTLGILQIPAASLCLGLAAPRARSTGDLSHLCLGLAAPRAHCLPSDGLPGILNHKNSCMDGTDYGTTGSETRIYPYCLFWLFRIHYLWRDYFAQPRYSGQDLVPASKQCARLCLLPIESLTLSEKWKGVEWGRRKQEEGRQWELGFVCEMRKD